MSFIGSMLGAGQGSDWVAPPTSSSGMINPVTPAQTDQAYAQSQDAIKQQQALVTALQGQNGIANQNAAFGAYQGLASGTGPNPAQAQLAQATSANVANQNALMAGQRGAGANVGLIARQSAMQGSNIQQQSAGQAATLGAQQQIAGIQGMAGVAGQQVGNQMGAIQGLNQASQSEQQNLLGSIAATNNASGQLAGNQNTANSNIQIQNSKAQQGIFGGLLGGAGSILAKGGMVKDDKPTASNQKPPVMLAEGGSPQGESHVRSYLYGSAPSQNAQNPLQVAGSNMNQSEPSQQIQSGTGQLIGKVIEKTGAKDYLHSLFSSAPSPDINTQLPGGDAANPFNAPNSSQLSATPANSSGMGAGSEEIDPAYLSADTGVAADASAEGGSAAAGGDAAAAGEGAGAAEAGGAAATEASSADTLAALLAKGGKIKGKKVDALVSPGEVYLPPKKAAEVSQGKANPIREGKHIPGKAKVKGDSYANDTVPAKLEEGGIVIPRSILQSDDPAGHAIRFVRAHLAKAKQGLK